MKKSLSLITALVMLIGIMSAFAMTASAAVPTQPAAPANGGETFWFGAESATSVFNGGFFGSAGVGEVVSVASGEKNLIKVTSNVDAGDVYCIYFLTGGPFVDATGKQYFEFWVDTTGAVTADWNEDGTEDGVALAIAIHSDGAHYQGAKQYNAQGAKYLIQVDGKWVEKTMDTTVPANASQSYPGIVLPVDYSGYVRVDFDTFKAANGGNGTLDLTKINFFELWYGTATAKSGSVLYFNDFKFVNAAAEAPESSGEAASSEVSGESAPLASSSGETNNGDTGSAFVAVTMVMVSSVAAASVAFTKKRK